MLTIICIMLLAYCVLGKDVRLLLDRLRKVDWKNKSKELLDKLHPYVVKVGRIAAKPLLQFYYVMTDEHTPVLEKALVYAAIVYTISPVSLIPSTVYKLLGVLDEGVAMLYVYKKIKNRITPEIDMKVENTLDEWFGETYVQVEEEYLLESFEEYGKVWNE